MTAQPIHPMHSSPFFDSDPFRLYKHLLLNVLYQLPSIADAVNFILVNKKCLDVSRMVKMLPDYSCIEYLRTTRHALRIFPNAESASLRADYIAYLHADMSHLNIILKDIGSIDTIAHIASNIVGLHDVNVLHLRRLPHFPRLRSCSFHCPSLAASLDELELFVVSHATLAETIRIAFHSARQVAQNKAALRRLGQQRHAVCEMRDWISQAKYLALQSGVGSNVTFVTRHAHGLRHFVQQDVLFHSRTPLSLYKDIAGDEFAAMFALYYTVRVELRGVTISQANEAAIRGVVEHPLLALSLGYISSRCVCTVALSTTITELTVQKCTRLRISNLHRMRLCAVSIDTSESGLDRIDMRSTTRLVLQQTSYEQLLERLDEHDHVDLQELHIKSVDLDVSLVALTSVTSVSVVNASVTFVEDNNVRRLSWSTGRVDGIRHLVGVTRISVLLSFRVCLRDAIHCKKLQVLEVRQASVGSTFGLPKSVRMIDVPLDVYRMIENVEELEVTEVRLSECKARDVRMPKGIRFISGATGVVMVENAEELELPQEVKDRFRKAEEMHGLQDIGQSLAQ